MKKLGFTLSETLIVICVLGIIAMITVAKTVNFEKTNEKKILSVTQSFYSNIENSYQNMLFDYANNGNVKYLQDINGDGKVDAIDLRDGMLKYMEGEAYDCDALINNSKDYILDTSLSSCAALNPNIIASFTYDSTCNMDVLTKEYYNSTKEADSRKNACGSIIYGIQDGKGIFDYDIFAIALGKRGIKK